MKINISEIEKIIALVKDNNLGKIKYTEKEYTIEIENEEKVNVISSSVAQSTNTEIVTTAPNDKKPNSISSNLKEVQNTIIGNFYLTKGPTEPDLIKVGQKVKKGQLIGIIEAMKIMNEVKSPYDGVIKKINYKNDEFVDMESILMLIEAT